MFNGKKNCSFIFADVLQKRFAVVKTADNWKKKNISNATSKYLDAWFIFESDKEVVIFKKTSFSVGYHKTIERKDNFSTKMIPWTRNGALCLYIVIL